MMMAVNPTLIFQGCMSSPYSSNEAGSRGFASPASAAVAIVPAKGPRHSRLRPAIASMHGEARRRFRADALSGVVLSRNLHIHPAAASIKVILKLRVRVFDLPGLNG